VINKAESKKQKAKVTELRARDTHCFDFCFLLFAFCF